MRHQLYFKGFGIKKTVLVAGRFNIVHPGHLRLLHFAKSRGEHLIVAVFENDSETFVDLSDRLAAVEALDMVSEVIPIPEEELIRLIEKVRPTFVVKGKEHEIGPNPEKEILSSYGGRLIFGSGETQFSSRDLLARDLLEPPSVNFRDARNFLAKHKISQDKLISTIEDFTKAKALVVGEVILDEYTYCDPLGMSQEDPTIVVTPVDTKVFLGGAGIVAAHLNALGASATIISVVGDDQQAGVVKSALEEYGVKPLLITDDSRPTILKNRYRASNKTLLRVSHLRSHDIGDQQFNEILHQFVRAVDNVDLVIFSDFNYGVLPKSLVEKLVKICRDKGIPYFADSQASSQTGDVSRFKGAALISATEREARLAINDFKSGLQSIANLLLLRSSAENLVVKLGAEGLIGLCTRPRPATDTLAALNPNPLDVAGAGDAFLATASLSIFAGADIWEACYLGSTMAGVQVSRMGNIPIEREVLLDKIRRT